jgi:ribosomal RNA assembly protein
MKYVKIPQNRVGVLIGKEGSVKAEVEKRLGVKLKIDAEDGVVSIENVGGDVLAEWKARDIAKAIGRGMSPEKALKLCSDEYVLDLIELPDIVGRSPKAISRQKGRLIGKDGKTRKLIEELTGVHISIYGKTVAIVGESEEVALAREGVLMIARGVPHGVAYKVLERKRRMLKEKRVRLWKT